MNLYTQSQIGSKVARIVRVAGKVDSELHVVLCSILDHTREHGDYTAILPLMNGLPSGQRKEAIVKWISHFSGKQLVLSQDKKTKIWKGELVPNRNQELFDIVGAMAITFGDFTQEPKPTTMTLELLIKQLEKTANDSSVNKADGSPKVTEDARMAAAKLAQAAKLLQARTMVAPVKASKNNSHPVDDILAQIAA